MKAYRAYYSILLFLWLLPLAAHANRSMNIVRDDEIEDAIMAIARPLLLAADLDPARVQIYIVEDNAVNAATNGGLNIYINTGLIKISNEPDMLAGVLAHEIGHIALGHMARADENMSDALDPVKMATLGVLSGIAAALSGNPILLALALAGPRNDYLHYTRIQEGSADTKASQILRKADISFDGMMQTMAFFNNYERLVMGRHSPIYNRTHPPTQDRLDYWQNEQRYFVGKRPGTTIEREGFSNMVDKLRGYTDPPANVINRYASSNSFGARYALAILSMRNKAFAKAESELNSLIAEQNDNPYLLASRAEVRFALGQSEAALQDLERASSLLGPRMSITKLELLSKKINMGATHEELTKIIGLLSGMIQKSEQLTNKAIATYILASAYQADKQASMSHITLSNLYLSMRDIKQAEQHYRIAKSLANHKDDHEITKLCHALNIAAHKIGYVGLAKLVC